jgi:DNA polymerase-3 subunit alpha
MKDIKPSGIEDLIALVALYRPGPMELIPTFIKRKNGQEKITYLHPKLEPILGNTYGIGVYQEQMMRIARDLAGYSLGEADTLRKAIGKKIKELLDEQQEKLINGMTKNGIDLRTAKAIWELFPPFARYGFNKSHAACYALIGYRTAYLRANYPEEFMASLLNADIGDTDRMSFLTGEAKQENLEVLGPDVNKSYVKFAPDGEKIRFGLLAIKNVGEAIAQAIVEERTRGGEFKDFADFVTRIEHKDLNKKSLESLAKSGALDSFGIERNQVLQNMDDILKYHNSLRKNLFSAQNSLFGATASAIPPLVLKPSEPATPTQRLTWEKELLGFYLSDHPLNHYGEKIKTIKARTVAELRAVKDERLIYRGAGLISSIKKIMTKTGQPMLFVTMEDFSPQPIELVVFNNTMQKTQDVWVENRIIAVEGKISFRNGEPSMIVEKAKSLEV